VPYYATGFNSVLKNVARCAVDFGCLNWVQAGIGCGSGVGAQFGG